MNSRIVLIIVFLCGMGPLTQAQNPLDPGFRMLETGQFEEAKQFFSEAMEAQPDNRTARLCYGRALGLSGSANEAVDFFRQMEESYPGDQEIRLNKAEAYLWAKRGNEALDAFEELYAQDATNFGITYGYANALSTVEQYPEALLMIDRALAMQSSPQILISKKYILLGMSSQSKKAGKLKEAERYLDTLEILFPNDRELLLSRAALYMTAQDFRPAQGVYDEMLKLGIDSLEASLGHTYTSTLFDRNKTAKKHADMAMHIATANGDSAQILRAVVNEINALGAGKKFKAAYASIDAWETRWGKILPLQLARGRLLLWQGKYHASAEVYENLAAQYPDSYEVWVGLAETCFARKENKKALAHLDKAISLDPVRVDAGMLKDRIISSGRPVLQISGSYMQDNGDNLSNEIQGAVDLARYGKIRPLLRFAHKSTSQAGEGLRANRTRLGAGFAWEPNYRLTLTSLTHAIMYSADLADTRANLLGEIGLQYQLGSRQNAGIKVERTLEDYNSELLRSGLGIWRFSANYYGSLLSGWGVYGQAGVSQFSDQNQNYWLFASLFRQIGALPGVKAGANYSRLGFKDSDASLYFSPENFQSAELFLQFQRQAKHFQHLSLLAELALGGQQIASGQWQSAYRWSVEASYKIGNKLSLRAAARGSNAADAAVAGYAFTSFELGLRYRL